MFKKRIPGHTRAVDAGGGPLVGEVGPTILWTNTFQRPNKYISGCLKKGSPAILRAVDVGGGPLVGEVGPTLLVICSTFVPISSHQTREN